MNPTPQIFISYRRDEGGHAGRLYDRLADTFGADAVFIAREDLTPGQPFQQELAQAIRSARVCLVVIGQHWLSPSNRQRLFEKNDFIRGEIRAALERVEAGSGYALIPILAGGAAMPSENDLPPDIAKLGTVRAHTLEEAHYAASVGTLIETLANQFEFEKVRGTDKPFHLIDQPLSKHYADPLGHLEQLRQLLEARGNATAQGMGGVGKTELALQYSHAYRNRYHGIWWFRAESTALLDEGCAAFCEQLEIKVPQGTPYRQALRDFLTQEPRWLLVYDNAEDARALHNYLPDGGPHHIIITSRQPHWGNAESLHLDVWSDEQALDFLGQRLPKASDEQHRVLSHALGGLPLALEQACAYLIKTGVGIDDYIANLADFQDPASPLDREDSALYPRSVLATLSLAFNRLSEPARALLHLCAWLAPESIPEYLFTEKPGLLPPALAAIAAEQRTWRESVAELTGYALCQTSADDAGVPVLLFHRLTQAAVQLQRTAQKEEDAGQSLALLRAAFPGDTEHPDHWPRCAALMPHVLNFESWHCRGLSPNPNRLTWLLDRLADYLFNARGLYGEAMCLQRRTLAIAREHDDEEHPNTLAMMNNLARTLQAQGDLAGARQLQESVLVAIRRQLGDAHPDTLTSMGNLASILYTQGDLSGARELEETALTALRHLLGEAHPDTLTSMNNLASTLKAQGDLAGAHELQESVLAARRRLLGEAHPATLTSMNNLALTLRDQGKLAAARELTESVLSAHRHLLGEDHPDTLRSMNNLASTLLAQGDFADARKLQESALDSRRRVLGDRHPDTLTSMNNLALTLQAQGDLVSARELLLSVLTTHGQLLGAEHPDTIASAWNLFTTLYQLNDRSAADKLLQHHLLPLLKADTDSLSSDLQRIQEQLRAFVAAVSRPEAGSSGNAEAKNKP